MNRREYPRVGRAEKRPRMNGQKCIVCGEKATHRQAIQVSWFRGDDEIVLTCGAHANTLAAVKAWESIGSAPTTQRSPQ